MPYGVYCPLPTALPTVGPSSCRDYFAKAAKFIIQRNLSTNYFDGSGATPTNAIGDPDSWTDLPDATDDTKVTITGFLEDVVFAEQGDIDEGENIDGAPIAVAAGTTMVTAMMRATTPAEQAAYAALAIEENLMVYVLDANGVFMCRLVDVDIHAGIPISIQTFRAKGAARGGTKADQFKTSISFHLKSNWYETAAFVVPDAGFDPLTLAPSA